MDKFLKCYDLPWNLPENKFILNRMQFYANEKATFPPRVFIFFVQAVNLNPSESAAVYHINTDQTAIIDLPLNTPVTVIDENGITSVYEYTVEPSLTRSGSLRAKVSRTASTTFGDYVGNAYLTLWADAIWGNRTVPTIGDWASGNYDFELWLDPANMTSRGILKINDSSDLFGG